MKNLILFSFIVCIILLSACGPAAEEREQMMSRSKIFQDSIANMLHVSMAEAEAPGPVRYPAKPTATAAANTTAAPTAPTATPAAPAKK